MRRVGVNRRDWCRECKIFVSGSRYIFYIWGGGFVLFFWFACVLDLEIGSPYWVPFAMTGLL